MFKEGTVVRDEDGKLFVVAMITTKVILCYQYPRNSKPTAYAFNPYQLQEVTKKGIVVDKNV